MSKATAYPASVRPGERLFVHGTDWKGAEVRLTGNHDLPIARVLVGRRTRTGVSPANGEFHVALQTNGCSPGRLKISLESGEKGESATVSAKVRKWLLKKPDGGLASKAHWRMERMFRQRFADMGYAPELLRRRQIQGVAAARKRRDELCEAKQLHFTPHNAGGCAWTPLGAAPVQREFPLGDGSNAPSSGRALAIAVHPQDRTKLYLGTASGGLWRSEDGGRTWYPQADGWTSAAVGDIAIAKQDPNVIVAGTGEYSSVAFYSGSGLMVSTDAGASWFARGESVLDGACVSRIVIDPDDPAAHRAYVATDVGLFKTDLATDQWQLIDAKPCSDLVLLQPNAANPSRRLLAGVHGQGVFVAVETGGGDFPQLSLLHAPTDGFGRVALSQAANRPDTIWAAFEADRPNALLSRSLDGGSSWIALADGPAVGNTWYTWPLCAHPDSDEVVYLGETFLKRRKENGEWETVGNEDLLQGFRTGIHVDQQAIHISPADANHIWVCNDGGIWYSSDGGRNFYHRNGGLATLQNTHFVSHWSLDALLFAGSQDNGAFVSVGSPIWQFSATGDAGMVGFDRTLRRFYKSTYRHDVRRSDVFGRGGYAMKTAGLDSSLPVEFYPPFVVDLRTDGLCWFADTKLWRTTDHGDSWSSVSEAVAASMTVIEPHPTDDTIVFGGTWQGEVFKFQRVGPSWSPQDVSVTSLGFPAPGVHVADIAVDLQDRLWVASAAVHFGGWPGEFGQDHVFRHVAGTTWETKSNGLVPGNPVNTIVVDPAAPGRMFVGADAGVFRTDDFGESWVIFDEGLPNAPVVHLSIQESERLLRAATYGRSVWERPIDAFACRSITLLLRDTWLDTGRNTTPADGFNDPLDPTELLGWWDSPDIRVDAPVQGAFETVPIDDALAFDALKHTGDFLRGDSEVTGFGQARVYVQLHNRGPAVARDARVRVYSTVANATETPALPANFWAADPFAAGNVYATWRAIGPAQRVTVRPAVPAVIRFDTTITNPREASVLYLALTTHEDDPFEETELRDVALLVRRHRHVAFTSVLIHAYQAHHDDLERENTRSVRITRPDLDAHEYLVWRWGRIPQRGRVLLAVESSDGRSAISGSKSALAKRGLRPAKASDAKAIPDAVVYELKRPAGGENRIPLYTRAGTDVRLFYNLALPGEKAGTRFDFKFYRERDKLVPGGTRVDVQVINPI